MRIIKCEHRQGVRRDTFMSLVFTEIKCLKRINILPGTSSVIIGKFILGITHT